MKKLLLLLSFCFLFVISGGAQGAETWVKVTEAPTDWSGDYLIVYEGGNVAFDGSLTTLDATNNIKKEVEIADGVITTTDCDFYFTINSEGTTIQSTSGYYIGNNSDSNALSASKTTVYTNAISIKNDGTAEIKSSGGAYLRYNKSSDQLRFRYYKSGSYTGQQAITLYKKQAEVNPTPAAPVFSIEGGYVEAGTVVTVTYEDVDDATLQLYAGENAVEGTSYTVNETVTLRAVVTNKYGETAEMSATYIVASKYMLSDVLTINDAGKPSSYTNFEITTKNGAAYAGRAASDYNSFQINGSTGSTSSARGSGIFMTKSVGNVNKVIIKWNANTSATKRTLAIYGKNEPYEAYVSEENDELLKYRLGDEKSQGTKLTSFTYDGSTTKVEYIVKGQYRYLMILPTSSNAMYLESIEFVWDDAYSGGKESTYTLLDAGKSLSNGNYAVLVSGNIAVSRADATQGAEVTLGENNLVLEKAQTDVDEFEVISSGNTINGKSGFYLYGGVENEVIKNRHYLGTPSFVTNETEAAEFYVDDAALLRYAADGNYLAYVGGAFVKSADSAGAVTLYVNDSGITTDVEAVEIEDADAPVEYYNLQGVRVANPQNGLYIVRQGNKVSKQIIR